MKMNRLLTIALLVILMILITACRGHVPCDTDVMICAWI
jgi:hypothetical protein